MNTTPRRLTRLALACLLLAAGALVRAHIAYANSWASPTHLPHFNELMASIPSEPREPGYWPSSPISEPALTLALLGLGLALCLASISLALAALKRGESRGTFAGVTVLSVALAALILRPVSWMWAVHVMYS